jgi:hypothetical protein
MGIKRPAHRRFSDWASVWETGKQVNAMTNAMTIEILAFLAVAASLVLAGFATGPIVARRVNSSGQRHYHY